MLRLGVEHVFRFVELVGLLGSRRRGPVVAAGGEEQQGNGQG